MTSMDPTECLVVDFGSYYTKSGFWGEELSSPTHVFPSVVGRPRRRYVSQYPPEICYIGDECSPHQGHLSLSHPMDHGHIDDWLEFEELFVYTMLKNKAHHAPNVPIAERIDNLADTEVYFRDTALLLAVPPATSSKHIETLAEFAFEMMNFPQVMMATQGTLSLFAQGRDTGLAVEIGHSLTQLVPTVAGYCDRSATKRLDIGGGEVTMFLQKLLCDEGYTLTTRRDLEVVEKIKQQCVYVCSDPMELSPDDIANGPGYCHVLPDGHRLRSGHTTVQVPRDIQFMVSEALFEPALIRRDEKGLTQGIWDVMTCSHVENRRQLLSAICLSGGGSLIPGLSERIAKEVSATAPAKAAAGVKVYAQDDRQHLAFQGGLMIADPGKRLNASSWIHRQDYSDLGVRAFDNKIV